MQLQGSKVNTKQTIYYEVSLSLVFLLFFLVHRYNFVCWYGHKHVQKIELGTQIKMLNIDVSQKKIKNHLLPQELIATWMFCCVAAQNDTPQLAGQVTPVLLHYLQLGEEESKSLFHYLLRIYIYIFFFSKKG